jgi:F-type H+-transporting ATPase subunit b
MIDKIIRPAFLLALTVCFVLVSAQPRVQAQSQSPPQPAQSSSGHGENDGARQSAQNAERSDQDSGHQGFGAELARETREAEGVEPEEHTELKYSAMVRKLAVLTGGNVRRAHQLALGVNFALVIFAIVWFARKYLPGILRARNESIRHALDQARKASAEAHQRLADIETRLRQLDVEIGHLQSSAEKEAEAEESRIKNAAEEEVQKVVESAKLEIAAAAKMARRELSTHTADLAIALARKQINIDPNTDQVLVRNFAAKLVTPQNDNGKDGR